MNSPDWNIGYTTRSHLCIDLDDTTLSKVYGLIDLLLKNYPEIGNCLILESSTRKLSIKWRIMPGFDMSPIVRRNSYHLIFNNLMSYSECCDIIIVLAELDILNHEYVRIREMRNDMTIRVSKTELTDGTKQKPKIVDCVQNKYCKKDGNGIRLFLALYKAC